METKRCQRCHKLLRAEAMVCSRCGGLDFVQVRIGETPAGTRRTIPLKEPPSLPSNPPASPHRAGHYSGVHPEDQPYQSSFLPALRPPVPTRHIFEEEADDISFSKAADSSIASTPALSPQRRVASFSPAPPPGPQRSVQTNGHISPAPHVQQYETVPEQERKTEQNGVYTPTLPYDAPEPLPLEISPTVHRQRGGGRTISILLILSCLLFLIATSILAFLLLNSKPTTALKSALFAEPTTPLGAGDTLLLTGSRFQPGALVNFTHDAHLPIRDANGHPLQVRTFGTGAFTVQTTIPPDWTAGVHTIYATDQQKDSASTTITIEQKTPTTTTPPLLQLANKSIDLGADSAGVVSHTTVTLTNAGGGQVNWQASSDSLWLTIAPPQGTFAGSMVVTITVDRSNLSANSYSGHVTFIGQDGNNKPLVLTVTMAVNPASADLGLSHAALTFNGTTAQNPVDQRITLQNTGGQPLDWTATVATVGSGNWLALSPTGGHLPPGYQAAVTVSASSFGLGAGTYQGTLTFSYAGATATPVQVTLIVSPVSPPPSLSVAGLAVTPQNLIFNAIQGQNPQNPPAQSFTISNPGSAPLNWGINQDANSAAIAPVSSTRGTLAPSRSITVTVTPAITQLKAGVATALITVGDTDAGSPVKSQQVKVTFTIVNQAVISVNGNAMSFSHDSTITLSSQFLDITNTGSATLNWAIQISNNSPVPWLSVDNSSGTLVPTGVDFVNVTCDSTHLAPGTYTASLQVMDTDQGTPVTPQTITVTLTVS